MQIFRYGENPNLDSSQIITLISHIKWDEFKEPMEAENIESIRNIPQYFYSQKSQAMNFWLAVIENKLIGCIGLKILNDNSAEIKRFFIDKNFRGMGVSVALMSTAVEQAKSENKSKVYVGTGSVNTRAISFYLKAGFIEIGRQELPEGYHVDPLDDRFFICLF